VTPRITVVLVSNSVKVAGSGPLSPRRQLLGTMGIPCEKPRPERWLPVLRFCLLVCCLCIPTLPAIPAPPVAPAPVERSLAGKLESVIDGPDYRHASWGILIVNAKTGETLYERNAETLFAPASVTKLFSCAAALMAVGPESTTETPVYQRGGVINGVLKGDLILVAAGDLTLGGRTKDGKTVFKDKDHTYANSGLAESELTETDPLGGLNALAKQIKDAGISQVDGEVLIDDRLFTRTRGSGSGPDAVSPILVNDNVVDIVIEPGAKEGEPAKVTTRPETAFYQVDALVSTGSEKAPLSIRLTPVGPNQFAVRGKIPARGKPQVRIYPVEEPALFARALFIESLRRAGVKANAAVLRPGSVDLPRRDGYDKLTKVATFTSPPFKDAIRVTLKVSHNLYASTLPCLVAVARGFSTADAGLREQRKLLKELGVDVNQISFGGGAGGAPADHVTPRATVQLLQGMAQRPEWEAYKSALPILGVDGTLAEAVGGESPARGKVFAKTGTLIWSDTSNDRFLLKSKALAGMMTTKNGTPLYIAMFVNNVPLPDGVGSSREGKTMGKLCEILYEMGP
jgi:serine-type D-Ala-D-Ala carboxypeptidase/endopeptidase (penicillin-binding protein 4)